MYELGILLLFISVIISPAKGEGKPLVVDDVDARAEMIPSLVLSLELVLDDTVELVDARFTPSRRVGGLRSSLAQISIYKEAENILVNFFLQLSTLLLDALGFKGLQVSHILTLRCAALAEKCAHDVHGSNLAL